VSRLKVSLGAAGGDTGKITLNGKEISFTTGTASSMFTTIAAAVAAENTSNPTTSKLRNIKVVLNGDNIDFVSTVAGSPFTLSQAKIVPSTSSDTLTLSTVTENSFGSNDTTGIPDATVTSTSARTLYSTVRLSPILRYCPSYLRPRALHRQTSSTSC
jgi:hypothetical protein